MNCHEGIKFKVPPFEQVSCNHCLECKKVRWCQVKYLCKCIKCECPDEQWVSPRPQYPQEVVIQPVTWNNVKDDFPLYDTDVIISNGIDIFKAQLKCLKKKRDLGFVEKDMWVLTEDLYLLCKGESSCYTCNDFEEIDFSFELFCWWTNMIELPKGS